VKSKLGHRAAAAAVLLLVIAMSLGAVSARMSPAVAATSNPGSGTFIPTNPPLGGLNPAAGPNPAVDLGPILVSGCRLVRGSWELFGRVGNHP
jgi:hypothetical protein